MLIPLVCNLWSHFKMIFPISLKSVFDADAPYVSLINSCSVAYYLVIYLHTYSVYFVIFYTSKLRLVNNRVASFDFPFFITLITTFFRDV